MLLWIWLICLRLSSQWLSVLSSASCWSLETSSTRELDLWKKGLSKVTPSKKTRLAHDEFYAQLLTVIVLFCASGTGIYGSLESGMTGDASILISKSILDFFTAMIFSCSLVYIVSMIAIPQFIVFFLLFLSGGIILPLTTKAMIGDFKACGGFLMIATGFLVLWNYVNSQQQTWFQPWFWLCLFLGLGLIGSCLFLAEITIEITKYR